MSERIVTTAATTGLGLVVQEPMLGFATEQTISPEKLAFLTKLPEIDFQSRILVTMALNVGNVTVKAGEPIINTNFRNLVVYPGLSDLYAGIKRSDLPDRVVIRTDQETMSKLLDGKARGERRGLLSLVQKLSGLKESPEIRVILVATDCQPGQRGEISRERGREEFFQGIDLADAKAGGNIGEGLVWVVGRPHEKAERPGSDQTRQPYFEAVKERVAKLYEEHGWRVVSFAEIESKLKGTRFPPETWKKLKAGFGVLLSPSSCECVFHVGIQGEETQIYKCPQEDHFPVVEKKHKAETPILIGDIPLEAKCEKCGGCLTLKRILGVFDDKTKRQQVLFQITCPHDGIVEDWYGEYWLRKGRALYQIPEEKREEGVI